MSTTALPSGKNVPSLVPINIGSVLDNTDDSNHSKWTQNTLTKCKLFGNFLFSTVQVYARITDSNDNDEKKDNQNHALLILSGGRPNYKPYQYIFDRPKSIRFVKITISNKEELISRNLILIKEYNVQVMYTHDIQPFILKESAKTYNNSTNNNLNFIYNFIDKILIKCDEWNDDFDTFCEFVRSHFKKKNIKKIKENQLQETNNLIAILTKEKELYQKYIQLLNPKPERLSWKKNCKLFVKSKDWNGKNNWYIGNILKIEPRNGNTNKAVDDLIIAYKKLGNTFKIRLSRDSNLVKPFIQIPSRFLDPITKKIMTDPVQILKSGMDYDAITVKYLQEFSQNNVHLDPITGVLISIGKKKPIVVKKQKLKQEIIQFCNKHYIDNDLYNNFKYVNNDDVWKKVWKELQNKYDVKQQQKRIYGKCVTMFYPEHASKIGIPIDGNTDAKNDDNNNNNVDDNDDYTLRWDSDNMFINHTSIPIMTCMGPSRIGKSYLLSEILRNQASWQKNKELKKKTVYRISKSPTEPLTKGAWVSLYGDINVSNNDNWDKINNKNHLITLIDQWPEDDTDMWGIHDVESWFISLHPEFNKLYPKIMEYIKQHEIVGKTLNKLNNKSLLINQIGLKPKYANVLCDILDKRLRSKIDEINSNKINQMYLIDMEGLSHGVTSFTKKLFEGCYAVSNVVIWYDQRVGSDEFKKLMNQLKDNMKIIANSSRKPAFIYVLRDGPNYDFNFDINADDDDTKDDADTDDGDTDVDSDDDFDDSDSDSENISDDDDTDDDYDPNDFNLYINSHETFKWFRDMNIFSSIHGYKLELRKKNKKGYDPKTMNRLVDKIKEVSHKTARFANNTYILNDQINNINKDSQLSLEKRCALCNSKLKWFIFSQIDKKKSELEMKNAIIIFDYNVYSVNAHFDQGLQSLKRILKMRQLKISQSFENELVQNKIKIIKEIQKILEERKNATLNVSTRSKLFGAIGAAAGVAAAGAMAVATGAIAVPAAIAIAGATVSAQAVGLTAGATMTVSGAVSYYYSRWELPKLSRKITETDLSELELF